MSSPSPFPRTSRSPVFDGPLAPRRAGTPPARRALSLSEGGLQLAHDLAKGPQMELVGATLRGAMLGSPRAAARTASFAALRLGIQQDAGHPRLRASKIAARNTSASGRRRVQAAGMARSPSSAQAGPYATDDYSLSPVPMTPRRLDYDHTGYNSLTPPRHRSTPPRQRLLLDPASPQEESVGGMVTPTQEESSCGATLGEQLLERLRRETAVLHAKRHQTWDQMTLAGLLSSMPRSVGEGTFKSFLQDGSLLSPGGDAAY